MNIIIKTIFKKHKAMLEAPNTEMGEQSNQMQTLKEWMWEYVQLLISSLVIQNEFVI